MLPASTTRHPVQLLETKRNRIKGALSSLWLLITCVCLDVQAAPGLFEHGLELRGVAVPFYAEGERQPSAVLRVARLHTDYETKGFFRIGVLPIEVMEGVSLEVQRADHLASSLMDLDRWLGRKAAKRLELREFRLLVYASEGKTNRLEAGRVRFLEDGRWSYWMRSAILPARHLSAPPAPICKSKAKVRAD